MNPPFSNINYELLDEDLQLMSSMQYYYEIQQLLQPITDGMRFNVMNRRNEDGNNYLFNMIRNSRENREIFSPRNPVKNQQLEKYLQLNQEKLKDNHFDKNKPFIKITAMRNSSVIRQSDQIYYINEFGLIGTQKNTTTQEIMIGRQPKTSNSDGEQVIPNDIILNENERTISRMHCRLITSEFFRIDSRLDPCYQKILLSFDKLPYNLRIHIGRFLEEPRDLFIQDLGSVFGTYIKIFRLQPQQLKQYQSYTIGSETNFSIVDCYDGNYQDGMFVDEYFYGIIKQISKKYEIFGIDKDKYQEIQTDDQIKLEDLIKTLKDYRYPFIIIKFSGQGIDSSKTLSLFINMTCEYKEYQLGRGQESHIRINSNTISRKQSRFYYNQKQNCWMIVDGAQDRDSANGTWLSLQNSNQKEKREESYKQCLKHNSEIKISDYILKIELFQTKYQKKLQEKELISLLV